MATLPFPLALVLLALAAGLVSAWLCWALMPWFVRYAMARPNARSSHTVPTPQGGGVSVMLAFAVFGTGGTALLGLPLEPALWLIAVGLAMAALGAWDDVRPLEPALKFLFQVVLVMLLTKGPPPPLGLLPERMAVVEVIVLIFGLLWFVNLTNFMDGLDWMVVAGLGPALAALALFAAGGWLPPGIGLLAAVLAGALAGFAPFNRPVARLFLGDVGSLSIGLVLGAMLIELARAGHLAAALLLPLVFVADATLTLARRQLTGEHVWQAHRTHVYQRATTLGWTVPQIVARVGGVSLALAVLAALSLPVRPWAQLALLACGAALVAWLLVTLSRRPGAGRA